MIGRSVSDWSKELASAKQDLEYLNETEKDFSAKHLFTFSKLESTKKIEKTPDKREIASEETTPIPRGNRTIKPTEPVNLSDVFDVPLQVEDLKKATPVPGKKGRPPLVPVVSSLSLPSSPEKGHRIDVPQDYEYASSNNQEQDNIENFERFDFKPPILFAEERKKWHNSLRSYRGNRDATRPLWGKGSSCLRKESTKKQKRRRLNKTPPYLNSLRDIKPRRGNRCADFVGWAAHDRRRYEAPSASFGPQNLIEKRHSRKDTTSKLPLRVKTTIEDQHRDTTSSKSLEDSKKVEEKEREEMMESVPEISMPPGLKSPRRRSISRNEYASEICIPESVSVVFENNDAKTILVQVDDNNDDASKHDHRDATSPKRGRRSPRRKSVSRDAFITNESRSIHLSSEPAKEVALSSDITINRYNDGDNGYHKSKPVARRRSVSEKALQPSERSPQKHISESPSKGQGLSPAVPDDTQSPSVPSCTAVSRLYHALDAIQADEKKHHRPSQCVASRVVPEKRHPAKSDEDDVKRPSTLAEVTKLLRMSRGRKSEKEKKMGKTFLSRKNSNSAKQTQDEPTRRRADHKNWKSKSSRRRGSYFGTYAKPKVRLTEDEKTLWRNGIVRALRRAIASRRSLFGCHLEPWNLDDVFDTIDRSEDGYVDQSELANALHRLDISLSKSQLEELFQHIDRNADGLIQLVEFKSLIRSAVQSTRRWIDLEEEGDQRKTKKMTIKKPKHIKGRKKKKKNVVAENKRNGNKKINVEEKSKRIGTHIRRNQNRRVRLHVLKTWVTRLLLKTRKIRDGKRMEVARNKWRTRRLRLGLCVLRKRVEMKRKSIAQRRKVFMKWKQKTEMDRIESLRSHWIGWCSYVRSCRIERHVRREKQMEQDFVLLSNVMRVWRLYTDRAIMRREQLQRVQAIGIFSKLRKGFQTWREFSERSKREIQLCIQIQKMRNLSRIRHTLLEWRALTTRYQIFRHVKRRCLLRGALRGWKDFVRVQIRDVETSKMDRFMDSLVRDMTSNVRSSSSSSTRRVMNSSRQRRRARHEDSSSSLLRSTFAAWHMYVLMRRGFRNTTRRRGKKSSETKKNDDRKMSKTSGPLHLQDLHHITSRQSRSSDSRRRRRRRNNNRTEEKIMLDNGVEPENDILIEAILRKNRGELFRYASSHEQRELRDKLEGNRRRKKKWEPISLLVRRKLPSPSFY